MAFVTVKFGDDNNALFNPNCSVINLLDNIRRRCNCAKEIGIDLSDQEGVIQKLSEKYHQNASSILTERGIYILLRVEKMPDQPCIYSPLLNGLENSNPDLLAKLQNLSKPEEELPKHNSHQRKKSPWAERASVRKVNNRPRESSNLSTSKTSQDTGRESISKTDERYGSDSERKNTKLRKPASIKT